jgi:hypothetical protein
MKIKNNIFPIVEKKEDSNPFDNRIDDRNNYTPNDAKIKSNFEINTSSESSNDISSDEDNNDILYANQKAVRRIIKKLFNFITEILIGYSEKHHKKIFRKYIIRENKNYYNFSIIYDHIPRNNIIGKVEIDLTSNRFSDNQNISREFYPDNNLLRDIFKRKSDRDFPVRNIYLHEKKSEATILLKNFNIDNVLIFLRSFGAFRLKLRWNPAYHIKHNIQNNFYLKRRVAIY